MIFALIAFPDFRDYLVILNFLEAEWIQYSGGFMISLALIIGLAALYEMKNSWRIGIKYDQKTDLVTSGIYAVSRNPYFLSYDLLFMGIFLIFPSAILFSLVVMLMITFHFMILEEEQYLRKIQGEVYENYQRKTGRYI
jgi:protein-S-isoprenylcysteine O-methyltransferase Ste14